MLPIKNHYELFLDLVRLTQEEDSSFIRLNYTYESYFLSIFDYRLASYSDFLKPSAIESRGIMFEVDEKGDFIQLLALPMPKFFNYKENPLTIGIENHIVKQALLKEDGALISHFMLNDEVLFKSKGSIYSDQAIRAKQAVTEKQIQAIKKLHKDGYTVSFEYVSPDNRIVVPYFEEKLITLNARNRDTGKFLDHQELIRVFDYENVVESEQSFINKELEFFYEMIRQKEDIEGYVVISQCPESKVERIIKLKTDLYKEKHKLKDSCRTDTSEGRAALFSLTLSGHIDDLKESFLTDELSIRAINTMEEASVKFFNHEVNEATKLLSGKYESKKDFALNAKKQNIHNITFGVLMKMYDNNKNTDLEKTLKNAFVSQAKKITQNWRF